MTIPTTIVSPSNSAVRAATLFFLGSLLALVLGGLTALAPVFGAALGLGLFALLVGFVIPVPHLIVLTLVLSAVIAGSAEYFLRISQANWLPFMLAGLLAGRAVLQTAFSRGAQRPANEPKPMSAFIYPLILYVTLIFASALANAIPLPQAFAAFKNYLMMWGVLLAIGLLPMAKTIRWVWIGMITIALLQLPVVIFQRVFIASQVTNTASSLGFDAINGTFGGGLLGGRSGALAMFICIVLGYVLILWRDRRIGTGRMFFFAVFALPTLFIVEVKAVIFWLPVVAMLVFAAQIRRRPLLFLAGVAVSIAIVLGVIAAYSYSYYAPSGSRSLATFFTRDLAYMWDPNRFNPATRELGRISALVHWWREQDVGSMAQWLFGYGPGASRSASTVAVGTVAQKYPFYLDISAAAGLVWDIGLVGLMAFLSIFGVALVSALRLKRDPRLPEATRPYLEASIVGLLLIASSIIYVRDTVDGTTIQFLTCFFLGTIIHVAREVRAERARVGNVHRGEGY